jgi:hypothetical protein
LSIVADFARKQQLFKGESCQKKYKKKMVRKYTTTCQMKIVLSETIPKKEKSDLTRSIATAK